MAKVPTYQPTVTERPAFQQAITVQASAGDMGAAIGEGMQGLARGAQQASNVFENLNTLQATTDAKDRLNQQSAWQMERAYGPNGYLTLSGKAALDGYDKYIGDLRTKRSELSAKLSPEALAIYNQASSSRLLSAQQSALAHRAGAQKEYTIGVSTARQQLLADEALIHVDNPAKMNSALVMGAAEIQEQGALMGWPAEETQVKVRDYQSSVLSSAALKIAQADPIAALDFMGQHADQMTPLDGINLIDKLMPAVAAAASRDALETGSTPAVMPGSPAELIADFEGFSSTAYNDPETDEFGQQDGPNVYRAGYGSDTITRADGTVVKVDPTTVVSQQDAVRDLNRRLAAEFIPRAIEAVGPENWARLDSTTQAVLASLSYNYGWLPNSVARAVTTGDRMAIASAIEGLSGHNGGVNANRRSKEAALVRNGLGAGVQFSARTEGVISSLPGDMQVQVRETAANEINKQIAADAAQRRAASAIAKDTVALGIVNGSVTSEQDINLNPLLDDGDKFSLINTFRSQQNETANARAYSTARAAGEARVLNPFDKDDRSLANASYDIDISVVPPEQRDLVSIEFARETQIVPDKMIAGIRQGLNSADPAAVAAALEMSARLSEEAPMAVAHLENAKEIEEAAAKYSAMVDGKGWSADEAAAVVMAQSDPKNRRAVEQLKPLWTEAAKSLSINNVLEAFGDNWGPGGPISGVTPRQQQALLSEYLSATEAAFVGGAQGDIDTARRMALAEMKRTYGISTISGQEVVTAFPPERHYPAFGGSHDYLRDLAFADVRQVAPDAQNIILSPAPETAQDVRAGRPPRYELSYVSADGPIETLPGLFQVSADELRALSTLDSEERRLRLEIERQYNQYLRDRPNDFALSHIERMSAGLVGPPTAAEVVPNYADYQSQLVDIDLQRNSLLGNNATGATVMTREQIDPTGAAMDAEAQWNELNAATFGPMGGGQ